MRQQTSDHETQMEQNSASQLLLVDVKTDSCNVSTGNGDHWASFFTSTPFQPFVSNVSSCNPVPICNLSRLHKLPENDQIRPIHEVQGRN